MNNHRKLCYCLLVLVWTVAIVGIVPAHAQGLAPSIKLAPVWHPALQLTSLDPNGNRIWDTGDDIRYIEADIMVTTTVEFWAAEISCTVDKTILEGYTDIDSGPDGWHDDQSMVIWGDIWSWGSGFAEYVIPFDPATGKMTFVASKVAMSSPIGRNGESVSEKLAVIRYRVKPQAGTVNKTVALTCTSTFLDRNGKPVVVPTVQAPPPARITSGYNIQGTASYQARAAKAGIGVDCESYDTGLHYQTTTNTAGAFALNNIRDMGHFNCRIFSNLSDPAAGPQPDLYLSGWAEFNMGERGSMNILPVQLRGGDLTFDDNIDWNDINLITMNWQLNTNGDVNGDFKTDKADLAIVAGNVDWNTWMSAWHVLYGLPRVNTPTSNSRIWLGDYRSGAVTQFVANAGASQFHWPMLSPDGTRTAYSRSDGNTDLRKRKYELYVGDNITKIQKPLVTRAMLGSDNAFAPSWSPDGTRIAFVQSYGYFTSDTVWYNEAMWNMGTLAIVGADGRNYRSLYANTGIFPPTWLDNSTIIYACGDWWDSMDICYYDLWSDYWDYLDTADIPTDSDMPIIMNGNLYYRYTDTSSGIPPYPSRLRFAEIDWSVWPPDVAAYTEHPGLGGLGIQPKPAFVHTDVVYSDGADYWPVGDDQMDYYDVAWYGNQIMFNGFYDSGFQDTWFDWEVFNNDLGACGDPGTVDYCYPQWWLAEWHRVDSQMYNPWWSGDPDQSTWVHALRSTVDWVP